MEKIDLRWHGMLTLENIDQVATLLGQLLAGKKYTFVTANEHSDFKPDVRTNQTLLDTISVTRDKKGEKWSARFVVTDSYGMWYCSTNLEEQQYDGEFNNPHFTFKSDQVTITHRGPAGFKIYWVIAIQDD